MSQGLKTKINRIFDQAYNKGNLDTLDELIAAEYIRYQPPMQTVKGLDDYKKFVADVRSAYTGFEIGVDEIIIEGDASVTRITLKGKHTGQAPTLQAPPTGKQVEMKGCVVSHWKDGKIIEEWAYNDYLGLVQQFGVIPPPGLY